MNRGSSFPGVAAKPNYKLGAYRVDVAVDEPLGVVTPKSNKTWLPNNTGSTPPAKAKGATDEETDDAGQPNQQSSTHEMIFRCYERVRLLLLKDLGPE